MYISCAYCSPDTCAAVSHYISNHVVPYLVAPSETMSICGVKNLPSLPWGAPCPCVLVLSRFVLGPKSADCVYYM